MTRRALAKILLWVAAAAFLVALIATAAAQQGQQGQGQQGTSPPQQQQGQQQDFEPPQRRGRDAPPGERTGGGRQARPEIVVTFAPETAANAARDIADVFGLSLEARFALVTIDRRLARYRITDGRSLDALLEILRIDPRVEAAQRNLRYRPAQSAEPAGGSAPQYAADSLRLIEAHRLATGAGVTVAIVDGGLDARHPEFAAAVAQEIDVTGRAAGRRDHATALAGIIAGRGRLTGVAPGARLLSIRAFWAPEDAPDRLAGSSATVAKGVDRATAAGARILNLSFTGPRDPLVARLVGRALDQGTVVFAAAGNRGPDAGAAYPAALEGVIGIAAVDARDNAFGQGQQGPHVALAAPGVELLVAAPGGRFGIDSGTSLAAAHASGVAALILERQPGLDAAGVLAALRAGARDLGAPGNDPAFGAGRLDAAAALARLR